MSRIWGLIFAIVAVYATVCPTWAETRSLGAAQLIRPYSGQQIEGLSWNSRLVKVVSKDLDGADTPHAEILGKYLKPGWKLTMNGQDIPANEQGMFKLTVPLKAKQRTMRIIAVGPEGEVQMERDKIKFPGFDSWAKGNGVTPVPETDEVAENDVVQEKLPEPEPTPPPPEPVEAPKPEPVVEKKPEPTPRKVKPAQQAREATPGKTKRRVRKRRQVHVTPGIGFSQISFSDPRLASLQSGATSLSETVLTAKLALDWIPSRWTVGLSAYYNAAVLKSSTEKKIQFLGYNLRGGYQFSLSRKWILKLLAGFYYVTSSTASNDFGFTNITGPQLYPALVGYVGRGQSISIYAKYSPVSDGFSLLSFKNRELAGGISYLFPMSSSIGGVINFDAANLEVTIRNVKMTMSNFSLGFGVQF